MGRLSVFGKITHLKLPGLLIDPDETLFELIFKGPVLDIFKITVFLSVTFDDLVEVGDFLFEFLDFTGVVFEGGLHFFEFEIDFGDFLFEVFDLILFLCDYLLHGLVFLFEVVVLLFKGFVDVLKVFDGVLWW